MTHAKCNEERRTARLVALWGGDARVLGIGVDECVIVDSRCAYSVLRHTARNYISVALWAVGDE